MPKLVRTPLRPVQDPPMSLEKIKQVLIARAVVGRFLEPLRSFLTEMTLRWGKVPTACATRINKNAVIILGRKFFAKDVRDENEAADVLMHEIMHHVFLHVPMMKALKARGYKFRVQNLAMDAIINAYLHKIGCAGFMERFYKDENEFAFLRPNSTEFRLSSRFLFIPMKRSARSQPEKWAEFEAFYQKLYRLEATLENALEFFAKHFPKATGKPPMLGSHGEQGESGGASEEQTQPQESESSGESDPAPQPEPDEDNENGRGGQSKSEQEQKDQPGKPEKSDQADQNKEGDGQESDQADQDKKGGGGKQNSEDKPENGSGGESGDNPKNDDKDAGNQKKSGGNDEPVVSPFEAARTFAALGVRDVLKRVENNFARIIRKITAVSSKPGEERTGTRLSRRLPAKLSQKDMVRLDRGSNVFTHSDHHQRQPWILIDVSGSMAAYIPFMVGLVKSLKRLGLEVRVACWADRLLEIPFEELAEGKVPSSLGSGTTGEVVAHFIAQNSIEEAVIITDNYAGNITTKVDAMVHLCLIEESAQEGSFINRDVIRRCKVYQLHLTEDR